jgi:pimeloyl-ACP methyl ester carboxylesterase
VLGIAPEVIPGAGHLPHVEKAGAVNRLIRAALEVE